MTDESSNLELLLDTMCNAFGGVMFIAMLLAVLSQFMVDHPAEEDPVASATQAALAQRADELEKALQKAEEELAEIQKRIQSSSGEVPAMLQKLLEIQTKNQSKQATIAELVQRLSHIESEKRAKEAKVVDLEAQLARILKRIQSKTEQVVARSSGTRDWRIRVVRESQKQGFLLVVKWNELFPMRIPQRGNPVGSANSEAFETVGMGVRPIRGKGIPLGIPGWNRSGALRNILSNVPSASFNLQFGVYPDSYETYLEVDQFFRQNGYDTNWVIVPQMDTLLVLQRGPTEVHQ